MGSFHGTGESVEVEGAGRVQLERKAEEQQNLPRDSSLSSVVKEICRTAGAKIPSCSVFEAVYQITKGI